MAKSRTSMKDNTMKIKILFLCFLITSLTAQAAIYKLSPEKGKISFFAKGKPALISIKGEGEGATATLVEKNKELNGEVSFQLKTLTTGIKLRDEHLKNKYLEIEKYPVAILKITNLNIGDGLQKPFKFNAKLSLHGVEQLVEGDVTVIKESNNQKLSAEFKIKLSQFKIEIPNFQGITVAEDVEIKVDLPITKSE